MTIEKINLKGVGAEVELGILSSFVSKGRPPQTIGRRVHGAEKAQVEGSSSILIPSSRTREQLYPAAFYESPISHAYPILSRPCLVYCISAIGNFYSTQNP